MWIDTPEGWEKTARRLSREAESHRPVGLDCEFDGGGAEFSIRKQSPVARSHLVVWSVAVYTGAISPRGHRLATAVGLPAEAADHPSLRAWLESPAEKVAHNAPAEAHTFGNRGIKVGGLINTLPLSRFMCPDRADFGLDDLGVDLLGIGKSPWEWTRPNVVTVERRKKSKACECGAHPCRRRQSTPGHTRIIWEDITQEEVVRGKVDKDIRAIRPGHPEWEAWLAYFVRDSRLALELFSALERRDRRVPNPWMRAPAETGTTQKPLPQSQGLWDEEAA